LVEAAKLHALEKYGGGPADGDVAFVKLLQSDDGDAASFRRLNVKIRHRELYGASASAPRPAFDAITAKAVELRKAEPKLSQAQAFAKVWNDDPGLRERERAEHRRRIGHKRLGDKLPFEVTLEPRETNTWSVDDAMKALNELAAEQRRRAPWMSSERAFSAIYNDAGNAEAVARYKEARARALGVR
jgi:hypothetical protein